MNAIIGLVALLIWCAICGWIGYLIGNVKGRGNFGALIGALIGPLGWLIIAILPQDGPKCPECKGVLPSGAKRCKHCGFTLSFKPSEISNPGYYLISEDGMKQGPFTRAHLKILLHDGKISSETLVSKQGEDGSYPLNLLI